MSKLIKDEQYLRYQKNLAELLQMFNPKPTPEEIDRLKALYLEKRGEKGETVRD